MFGCISYIKIDTFLRFDHLTSDFVESYFDV